MAQLGDRSELGTAPPLPCRVVVLMSTFNGERFVAEQLQSILLQLPPTGRILIRDDGSTDGTLSAIRAIPDERLLLTEGSNIGFAKSFLTLLVGAPSNTDMVMFSDQDDVWLPGKIERAWRSLGPLADRPALYGSAQRLVDARLRLLDHSRGWRRSPSFEQAMVENIITGCTAALNRMALALLKRAGVPSEVHFHDWWTYLVVSAFGTVVFDPEPSVLYRQHGANQIGQGAGWWGRQLGILRFLLHNDWVGIMLGQLSALTEHFGEDLPHECRRLLQAYFAFEERRHLACTRWSLVVSTRRWRDDWFSEAAFRALAAAHKTHLWPMPGRRLRGSRVSARAGPTP